MENRYEMVARGDNGDVCPEVDAGFLKIVVVGEPKVGKSRLIRSFYAHNEPDDIRSYDPIDSYSCKFRLNHIHGEAEILEIPSTVEISRELEESHYATANAFVMMYAIDDPSSLRKLSEKWLPRIEHFATSKFKPVLLVGTKTDLRNEPEVIENLALNGEKLVTSEDCADLLRSVDGFFEISTYSMNLVNTVFNFIFHFILFLA